MMSSKCTWSKLLCVYSIIQMEDIDWDLLARHFFTKDVVDIEYELYGRNTFNRDGFTVTREEVQRPSRIDGAIDLLDQLCTIPEDRRRGGMEEHVRSKKRRRAPPSETSPSISIGCPRDQDGCMQGVWIRPGDRRRETGAVGVHSMWPDPATGCVYGGSCALLVRQAYEHCPCTHPPVQSNCTLPIRDSTIDWNLSSVFNRRRKVVYASRARWERDHIGFSDHDAEKTKTQPPLQTSRKLPRIDTRWRDSRRNRGKCIFPDSQDVQTS